MNEDVFYVAISLLPALASLGAVYVAKRAMERGLTYAVLQATLYTLIILAIGRLWHTGREVMELKGEWAEFVEYGINFIAYAYFIKVGWSASAIVTEKNKK